jgi:thioesterase domain-containing protein
MSVVGSPPRALVSVQTGAVGPPVYCFHPFGGSAAPYGGLAAHLGRDQLVKGVQAVGLEEGWTPDRSVPDMARRYASEIAADAQSYGAGPVLLLGYSMGGVLAVETGRLLRARTVEPTVVLVDCDPRYSPQQGGPWHILVHQVLALDLPLEQVVGLSRPDALAVVRSAAAAQRRLPARFNLGRLERMFQVCQHNDRAAAAHVPAHYPGTVHVLRSTGDEPPTGGEPTADAWHAYAGRAVVHTVPTNHHDIMGPAGYPHVAAHVRRLLAATTGTSRATDDGEES